MVRGERSEQLAVMNVRASWMQRNILNVGWHRSAGTGERSVSHRGSALQDSPIGIEGIATRRAVIGCEEKGMGAENESSRAF